MNRAAPALLATLALGVAGCPHPSPAVTTTGGGATGNGSGDDAGTGAVAPPDPGLHPIKVDVPWDAPGLAWDHAPAPGPEPAFTPPRPTELRLANGIRVLLVENHRLPLVSVRVVESRAGTREDAGALGLASLTGDLLDEGAGTWTSLTLPEEAERLGADLDVSVGADFAEASLDTLAETLAPSIGLLADVVLRPQLTQADFDRVKADTIEELKQRPDSPRRVAGLVFEATVFGAHPYGPPGNGFPSTVAKITLDDVKAFWKRMYAPSSTTIIVAGDVTADVLTPLLDGAFGAWKRAKPPAAKKPAAPRLTKPALVFVDRPGAPQSVVEIGRIGPSSKDPAYFALEVANKATGGSFASRLNHRLREELGYTYGIFSSFWRGAWGGAWTVSSALKTANTVAGIKEALAIIDRTRREALPDDELAKTKQLLTRGQPQDFETNASIAGVYEDVVVAGRPLTWPATWAAGIAEVSAAAAQKAAAKAWDQLVVVVVGDWQTLGQPLAELGLPISRVDTEGKPVP